MLLSVKIIVILGGGERNREIVGEGPQGSWLWPISQSECGIVRILQVAFMILMCLCIVLH